MSERTNLPFPDDEPEPTEEELRLAEELRRGLDGEAPSPDADYARALAAMHAPHDLDELGHERILRKALAQPAKTSQPAPRRTVFVGLSLVVAAAAAVAVVSLRSPQADAPPPTAQVARRSTEDLFTGPSGHGATTTERIDRIAQARSRDLRENRFARWGVR